MVMFMQEAIIEAKSAAGNLSPNPKVGCVIVKNNQIIARGYHRGPGFDHAEVDALKKIGYESRGADVYVTLEPCCHQGKTPPCTEALIRAGVKKVFFAMEDPNPLVSGRGAQALREAGIDVHEGLCAQEAAQINRFFIQFMKHQKPYVIAKWAMSLDGKMIVNAGDDRHMTGEESQQHAHALRNEVDAILVGVNTIIVDNPLLTTRFVSPAYHPLRIILDTAGRTPKDARVLSAPGQTIVVASYPCIIPGADVWVLPVKNNCIDLQALMVKLGEQGIMSLLVEGGPTVLNSFFEEGLVSETQVYVAPKVIGSFAKKKDLAWSEEKVLGEDRFMRCVWGRRHCEEAFFADVGIQKK